MFMKSSQDISNKILVGKDLNGRKIFFFLFMKETNLVKKQTFGSLSITTPANKHKKILK